MNCPKSKSDLKRIAKRYCLLGVGCNFDLAVRFLQRHERFLAAQTALRAAAQAASKRSRASQAAATPLCVVYHGTSKSNFHKIMDGNLKVPDGRSVTHVTDDGGPHYLNQRVRQGRGRLNKRKRQKTTTKETVRVWDFARAFLIVSGERERERARTTGHF